MNLSCFLMHSTQPKRLKPLMDGYVKVIKKPVKITGSRTWLNILGALNLSDIGRTVLNDYKTINDYNIVRFFNEIRKTYPDYQQKIHLIVDGAGYNHARLVKDWTYIVNIELHFLPPYSPNLNPIEYLWKVMNEHARNNRYFEKTGDFRESIFTFFKTTLLRIGDSLTGRIHDRFQVLKSASWGLLGIERLTGINWLIIFRIRRNNLNRAIPTIG